MSMKRVSLILTTFNSKENLEETITSIERQDYANIEVVIKDGESTDGTIEVIEDYAKKSKYHVVWTSRKDSGIFDAMNQGYQLSSGDIIAFFNDKFVSQEAVTKLVRAMAETDRHGNRKYDGVHADLVYTQGGKIIRYWKMGNGRIADGWMPAHPTLYLWRHVYERYGLFDKKFKCSGDYEFIIRILKDGSVRLAYIPEILIEMFYGGTSSKGVQNYLLSLAEAHRALKINGIKGSVFIDIKRTCRVLWQFLMAMRK